MIIFDFDGTLVDVSDRWYSLHLDLAKVFGFSPFPSEKYIRLKRERVSEEEIIKKASIPPEEIAAYTEQRAKLIETEEYLQQDRLKPGVKGLLERLARSCNLVLVSKRKNEKSYRREVVRLGVADYFDKILVADSQPKAQVIRQNLGKGLRQDVVLVGDTEDDLVAARELGVECWLVGDGVRLRNYLESLKPDRIFDKVTQIEWKR